MAEEQMIKITNHLTCPVCYELYEVPKYLPCYHSYCEECLVKLVVQSNITCPECRKTSVIPSGGVKQLPSNFFINRLLDEVALKRKVEGEVAKCDQCIREDPVEVLCLDCSIFLCNYCYGHHKYSKEYQNHSMIPLNELRSKKENITIKPKSKFALCQEHELELNFYCETCDKLVCQYCIMKDHLKHDHDTVKKMATKHRKKLDKTMEPVEKMIEGLSIACKKVKNVRDRIGAQLNDIDKEIDRYYEELHQQLQQQRDELKQELHEACRQKKKEVTLQLEKMEHTQAQLQSIMELNGAMKNGSDQEALLMEKQVVDNIKKISDTFNKLDTQLVQSATIEFIPAKEHKNVIPQFGHLLIINDTNPINCEALGIPEMVRKGKKCKFKIVTKDQNSHICYKGGSKVVIHAQSSRGSVTPVEVVDNKDGIYSTSFVVNQVGEVKLSVTINGNQIKGSPFNIKVHGKYSTIDKPSKVINEDGKMGSPLGIAFGRDGMWAVTDCTNNCVWILNKEDQIIRKFGSNRTDSGKFKRPFGIAFDANNHLYVTDFDNHRVQKFEINGNFILQFGTKGSSSGQLTSPLGITVYNDKVYVVECNGQRVSVFQLNGQFSHIIGSGHFNYPHYIAINANDQLLVADYYHHCISVFTLDGKYVGEFGTQGTSRGQMSNPSGIATDMYGFILVSDGNNRISVFNKDGVFMHSFGSKGSGHGQFLTPRQIAFNLTGDIYICDAGNKRIQIFSA